MLFSSSYLEGGGGHAYLDGFNKSAVRMVVEIEELCASI